MSIRFYSGLTEFLNELCEGNECSDDNGIQFITLLDPEFKIPIEYQSDLTHNIGSGKKLLTVLALSDDGGYCILSRNLDKHNLGPVLNRYRNLPSHMKIKLLDDYDLPSEIEGRYSLTNDELKVDSDSIRSYSTNPRYRHIKPTTDDRVEYKEFKDGNLDEPELLKEFKDKEEYQEFMEDYKRESRTVSNDPSIITNDVTVNSESESTEEVKEAKPVSVGDIPDRIKDKTQEDTFKGFGLNASDFDNSNVTEGTLVGTLMISSSYVHLFHLVSYNDLATHMALETYYREIVDIVDELAEGLLESKDINEFINVIYPGNDPLAYLESLLDFVKNSRLQLFANRGMTGIESLMDDIINLITGTLYKLKRLSSTKIFSSEFHVNKLELIKWKYNLSTSDLVASLNTGISEERKVFSDLTEVKNRTLNNLYKDINYYNKIK